VSCAACALPAEDVPTTTHDVDSQVIASGFATVLGVPAVGLNAAKVTPPSELVNNVLAPVAFVTAIARQFEEVHEALRTAVTAGVVGKLAAAQVVPPSFVTTRRGPPVLVVPAAMQFVAESQLSVRISPVPAGRVPPVVHVMPASVVLAAQTWVASAKMPMHKVLPLQPATCACAPFGAPELNVHFRVVICAP